MFLVKKWRRIHPSYIQQVMRIVNKEPVAWGIILLLSVLFLFPYTLHGLTIWTLGPYTILSLLPIIVGSLLRAHSGALVAWFLTMFGLLVAILAWLGASLLDWQITLPCIAISELIIALVAGQLRSLSLRLRRAYCRLEEAHATIQQQALTDALTGLPNHRAIMDQLRKDLNRARSYGRPFSLLFFDVDRFKQINDTYGHAAGDMVLCQIGERAGRVLRGGDTLGRFGGEEFVILLSEADTDAARSVAERLRAVVVAEPVAISEVEGSIAISVSIGLSTYPIDADSEQDLLKQADEAMYLAKRLGRNQMRTALEARLAGEDLELMALLQQEEQSETAQREEITVERLRETYTVRMVYSLLSLLEQRDESLSAHAHAVSYLATAMAQRMERNPKEVERIGLAALLHDIGKVAMPDRLLQKADLLTSAERAHLQEHAELGAQILQASPFLTDLTPAVCHHHEHWDGSGSPKHLAGEDIPLAARIIAVAEAYDFMQRTLPYQAGCSPEEAMVELWRCAGTQFDPAVVQTLVQVLAGQQRPQQPLQANGPVKGYSEILQ